MNIARLTKAELIARINQCEAETIAAIQREESLRAELDTTIQYVQEQQRQINALMYEQRPSRNAAPASHPVVMVGGRQCYRVTAWEHGRKVTTYKPVAQ